MPTLTIGRFSMSDGPVAIRHDGNNLDLDLQIDGATTTSPTVAKVLRQQLLGLANNADEPVVPITWSDDSDIDGYYVVEGVSVEPYEMYLNNGTMSASVSLRRVSGGYALPQQETITAAITRTNFASLAGSAITQAYPASGGSRAAEGGAVVIATQTPTVAPFSYSVLILPADHYIGSATVETQIGGSWYRVVGRQSSILSTWRITNGIVRFTPGTNGILEVWNGSAWESSANLRWMASGIASADFAATNAVIVRNSPECVVVRATQSTATVDFTIKRGAMHVEISSVVASGWGLAFATATACTQISQHAIHQTANDANGNRVVLGVIGTSGVQPSSVSLVSGVIGLGGGPGMAQMFIGNSLNGTTATAGNLVTDLRDQWIGIAPTRTRVVTR